MDQQSFTDFVMSNAQMDVNDLLLFDLSPEESDEKIKHYQSLLAKELSDKNIKVVLNNNIVASQSYKK